MVVHEARGGAEVAVVLHTEVARKGFDDIDSVVFGIVASSLASYGRGVVESCSVSWR